MNMATNSGIMIMQRDYTESESYYREYVHSKLATF